MPEPIAPEALSERVLNLVRSYVSARTERKCGIRYEDFRNRVVKDPETGKERMDVPQKYREAREAVATTAFLRVRACRSREDFVDYFTGTLCSVQQYLPKDEFSSLSLVLLDSERWEDVKALTMLALSATSRT